MGKWWNNIESVKESKNRRRFLTSFDMAEAKRMESVLNSEIKRGDRESLPYRYMCVCGCGSTGCIIVSEYKK